MAELAFHRAELIPLPNVNITIRPGVLSDVPFMDSLQKLHSKQVGWMPTKQFEGKIKLGHVLIAEEVGSRRYAVGTEENSSALPTADCIPPTPVGYCIGNDQYFKRDDVGIIYQMNVVPGKQRGLIGASLLKAQFERSAYGCKLYCCWCAQDIAANKFWEAMGFVPLAFRAGSEKKGPKGQPRVHIFWQKRIRRGDTETPWWFPAQTSGGSIREDRLVLPIPPGTHWSDAKPLILPGCEREGNGSREKALPTPRKVQKAEKVLVKSSSAISLGGLRAMPVKQAVQPALPKPKSAPKPKRKNDPRLLAAARELRDRWLEQVNADPRLLPSVGKYEVGKQLDVRPQPNPRQPAVLPGGEGINLLPAA
jgi:hypothetical protein